MKANLYWFTGLSGAGKTTIASTFFKIIRKSKKNIIFLDGDILREVLTENQKYSLIERKKLAMKYSKLCKMILDQDIDVVIATISMFHEIRNWNRENIDNYYEVYIKVPLGVLIERDQKNIYSRALKGEIKDVMGVNINLQEPRNPDVVILNDGSSSPTEIVEEILSQLHLNN